MVQKKVLTISIIAIISVLGLLGVIKGRQIHIVSKNIDSCIGGDIDLNFKTGASDVAGFGEGCLLYVFSYEGQLDDLKYTADCDDDLETYLCHTSNNQRLNNLFKELHDKYQNKQVVLIYKSGTEIFGNLIFADASENLIYYLDYSY